MRLKLTKMNSLWLALGLAALLAPGAAADCDAEGKSGDPNALKIAVSLAQFHRDWSACAATGCPPHIETLYGMSKLEGYIVDRPLRDVLLIGRKDASLPPLSAVDMIVAINNARGPNGGLKRSSPGVSIDPSPSVLQHLDLVMSHLDGNQSPARREEVLDAWCETCEQPQSVRVLGIPFQTHFARVMLDADYDMKGIVDGRFALEIDAFESLNVTAMKRAQQQILTAGNSALEVGGLTRFWFHPGRTEYRASADGALFDLVNVALLDEQEHVTRNGTIEASGKVNQMARDFTCAFSRKFHQIAAARPIYQELEGLFRWTVLAQLLANKDVLATVGRGHMDFATLQMSATSVPITVPGQSHVLRWDHRKIKGNIEHNISLVMPSCGGVSIRYDETAMSRNPDPSHQISQYYYASVGSRPARASRWWFY